MVTESDVPLAITALVENLKTSEGQQGIKPCTDSITAAISMSVDSKYPAREPKTETLALTQNTEPMADGRRA